MSNGGLFSTNSSERVIDGAHFAEHFLSYTINHVRLANYLRELLLEFDFNGSLKGSNSA